jgi:hypothetical protein
LAARHFAARIGLLLAAWWCIAGLALLLGGACLMGCGWLAERPLVGREMSAWAVPFVVLGLAGLSLGWWLNVKTTRAAQEILGERPSRTAPVPRSC